MNDSNHKQKNDKTYETEWSFSFENIGESLSKVFEGFGGEAEVEMASFSEPKGNATAATVNVNFSVGVTTFKPLVASDNLFEADVTYIGEIQFDVQGNTEKTITLKQPTRNPITRTIKQAFGSLNKDVDLRWDIRLNPDVPVALNIHGGVGEGDIDLAGINLTQLNVNTGVGKNTVTLPTSETGYAVKFNGGVGETVIDLPINTTTDIKISGGVGAVTLNLPPGAALKLTGKSGLGDIAVPKQMERLQESDDFITKSGVWQTQGFDQAAHQITVHYNGGVGELRVKSDVTVV